jgi:hypothetical protein
MEPRPSLSITRLDTAEYLPFLLYLQTHAVFVWPHVLADEAPRDVLDVSPSTEQLDY